MVFKFSDVGAVAFALALTYHKAKAAIGEQGIFEVMVALTSLT